MPLDKTDKQIIAIGAGVGLLYFGLLNPLLKWLGLKDDQETTGLDDAAKDPSSFWTINFWKSVPGAQILTRSSAENLARQLYDSFGWYNDDEEQAKATIKSLKYQTQLSYLSDIFYQIYSQDLLTFLRGGLYPFDRLSDADVYELNSFIKKLPVS